MENNIREQQPDHCQQNDYPDNDLVSSSFEKRDALFSFFFFLHTLSDDVEKVDGGFSALPRALDAAVGWV
jgi:hypothetical protein